MSRAYEPSHEQSPDATIASITSAKLTAEERKHLLAIESALSHMKEYTPTDPYVLTIPQDVEPRYHHYSSGQARQWLHNTPFDAREHEATQYQTFVYHEPGKDMYQLHVSRAVAEDEEGKRSVRKGGAGGTGANTPAQGEKKKISLGDYKRKVVGGTPDASVAKEKESDVTAKKALAVKGPVERIKADEEVLAAVHDGEDVLAPVMAEEEVKRDLKRKRGGSVANAQESSNSKGVETTAGDEEDAQSKKARRTSPPPRTPKRENSDKGAPKQQTTEPTHQIQPKADTPNPPELGRLPPKLSPPPPSSKAKQDPDNATSIPLLPGRLSPSIPANITSTLAARAHYRSTSRSSELSASGQRSASKDPASRQFTPPPKTIPKNAFRANSNSPAVRSDAEDRGRAVKPVSSRPKTPERSVEEDGEEIAVSKTKRLSRDPEATIEESDARPRRLLVKFKFKKSQREGVRRILRMRPNPVKVLAKERSVDGDDVSGRRASRSSVSGRRDTNAKGVAQKVGPANSTAKNRRGTAGSNSPPPFDRKRPRSEESDDSDTAPAKRRKQAPDNIEVKHSKEPSTPAPSDLLSPSSGQKPTSQQLTPSTMRKDVLSAAMKREHSTDSRLNTPPAMSQNSPTVNGTSQPQANTINGGGGGGPGRIEKDRQPSNKTPKQQAWEREQKRLETLGRELKHTASDHFKSLSLTHSDSASQPKEQKLAAVTAIESLLSYMLAFTCADEAALAADPKLQPSTKTWRSLHGFFGFVKRHCDAFPELVGLVCWLGVVFNARILELTTAAQQTSNESLLETSAMMQRAATEADTKLDVDLLSSTFPKTWEGRFRGSLAPASEALEVGKSFKGLYKLPLGLQTSPLRAARAGYAMLEEWVGQQMQEGHEFKLTL